MNVVPVPWISTMPNQMNIGLPQPVKVTSIPTQSPVALPWALPFAVSVAVTVKEPSPDGSTVMQSPVVESAVPPSTDHVYEPVAVSPHWVVVA